MFRICILLTIYCIYAFHLTRMSDDYLIEYGITPIARFFFVIHL
jgi:hypothetical protein